MLPCSAGPHSRNSVGLFAHTPDRYTDACPEYVHTDAPTCVGSASAIPTSARAAGAHAMTSSASQQRVATRLLMRDHAPVLSSYCPSYISNLTLGRENTPHAPLRPAGARTTLPAAPPSADRALRRCPRCVLRA